MSRRLLEGARRLIRRLPEFTVIPGTCAIRICYHRTLVPERSFHGARDIASLRKISQTKVVHGILRREARLVKDGLCWGREASLA